MRQDDQEVVERDAPEIPARVDWQRVEELQAIAQERRPPEPTPEEIAAVKLHGLEAYLRDLDFPAENCDVASWDEARTEPSWREPLAGYTGCLAENVKRGLWLSLSGPKGVGKTFGIAKIAVAARAQHVRCEYVRCGADLVYWCKQLEREPQRGLDLGEKIRRRWPASNVPLLLLDDLDMYDAGGYDPEREHYALISWMLYERLGDGLSTVFALNKRMVTGQKDKPGFLEMPEMDRVRDRLQDKLPACWRLVNARDSLRGKGE